MNKIKKQIDFFVSFLLKKNQQSYANFIKQNKNKISDYFTKELINIDIDKYFINYQISKYNNLFIFLTHYKTKEKIYKWIPINKIEKMQEMITNKQLEQLTTLLESKSKYWFLGQAKINNLIINFQDLNKITKLEAQILIKKLYENENDILQINKEYYEKWKKNNKLEWE